MLAVSALVTLIALEVGYRVVLSVRGTPYDGAAARALFQRGTDTTAAFVPGAEKKDEQDDSLGLLHPFYGAERVHDSGEVLATFRRGIPADVYTVVVVGGSVAANWSQDNGQIFKKRLEADPRLAGKRVFVLRYAHAAYKQPQQLTRLIFLLSFGYRPDAVINLDGFNEVACGWDNVLGGTHPLYPSPPVWGGILRARRDMGAGELDLMAEMRSTRGQMEALAERALDWNVTRSALLGKWFLSRYTALGVRRAELQEQFTGSGGGRLDPASQRQIKGPDFQGDLKVATELNVTCWFESSISMKELCDARDIYYLHCLQPTLHDPGAKIVSEEESKFVGAPGWKDGVLAGYPLLRQRGEELVQRGVSFVDTSRCFAGVADTLYYDACHFHAPGNRVLSEAIADAFLAHLPETL